MEPRKEEVPTEDDLNLNERVDRLEMAMEALADWVVHAQKHGITAHSTDEIEKIRRGESAKPKSGDK